MKFETVGFVAGIAGFLLGGWAVYTSTVAADRAQENLEVLDHDEEMADSTFARLAALEESSRTQSRRLNGLRDDENQLRDKVRELIARLDAVEKEVARRAGQAPRAAGPGQSEDVGSAAGGAPDAAEFDRLRRAVLAGEATPGDEARFWELARTTGVLDDVIEQFQADVKDAPRDVDGKMRLASAYTAKLLTVPDGPERGAWAARAEKQWGDVLEIDPENWQARYSRAFSWSQWPPFMGKGPAAIKEFEKLVEQQRRMTPAPEQAAVYLQLSQLYRSQGNAERADEVLRTGMERHPDSDRLKDALDAATR